MLISDEYKALNEELHRNKASYGTSGQLWADEVRRQAAAIGPSPTILDYGCGKGTLKNALKGYEVYEYDPAVPGKSGPPAPAHLVVCTDVLEHIEPDCLDDVLKDIHRLTKNWAFLVVAARPANKVLSDGRNAHLIVEPAEWWSKKLHEFFRYGVELESRQEGEAVFLAFP